MKFKSTTTLGRLSFFIAIIVLIGFLYPTLCDLMFPIDFNNPSKVDTHPSFFQQHEYLIMKIIAELSLIDFIMGIITLFQKESNRKMAIFAIVVSSPLALIWLYRTVLIVIFKLGML